MSEDNKNSSYAAAGVDTEAGERAVDLMRSAIAKSTRSEVVGDFGGFAVDRLTHSLQTATRAHRDGRDEDYVIMALLHDIGDTLGATNHPDIAAAILKPFVSEKLLWIVQNHGIFQGQNFFHHLGLDRDMREQFRGHEWFAETEEFIDKYDCPSFDPNYDTLPLEFFEPMVMKLFRSPLNSIYKRALETAA